MRRSIDSFGRFGCWACALLIVSVAMLWPALLNGHAAIHFDTLPYYKAGDAAVAVVSEKLGLSAVPVAEVMATGGASPATIPAKSAANVISTRALAYGLFVYLASWPATKFYIAIAVQSLVTTAILFLWWKRVTPSISPRAAMLCGLAVAAATSAPWFASFVLPDMFAGLALLCYALLLQPSDAPLGLGAKLFAVLTITFAFAAHASHIPVLALVAAVAIGQLVWECRGRLGRSDLADVAWLSTPIVVGMAVVLGTSLVGFSEASLAPKRLPLVLTRSIEDGPGRWYLEKTCPTKKYVICEMFPVLPKRQVDMIWGPNGLNTRATPEQMDAIRQEEPEIVAAAARAYPVQQALRSGRAFARQVFAIGLADVKFGKQVIQEDGKVRMASDAERAPIRPFVSLLIYATALVATLYLAWQAVRAPRSSVARLVALIFVGLLANAAVTGILSAVAQRYQSRVVWVLPVVALGLYMRRQSVEFQGVTKSTPVR